MSVFISFEGIDGCGKTTQLALLAEALSARGLSVVQTRNPGGTALGQQLRQILLHHPDPVDPTAELLLYMADRAQHRMEVLQPALAAGHVVLCDRYGDSTLAYQGYGRGLSIDWIERLNEQAGICPDMTFYFDGPVDTLLGRANKRGPADRLESESHRFFERVRQGFLTLSQQHPTRIQVLDATQPVDWLHQQILSQVGLRLRVETETGQAL
jgi:dTMP kinase